MPAVSSVTSLRSAILQRPRKRQPITARLSPWPKPLVCAPSRLAATGVLGTLYAKTGQREQVCIELATAIDLYRAMEMTFWLPQVKAILTQALEAQ